MNEQAVDPKTADFWLVILQIVAEILKLLLPKQEE